MSSLVSVIIPCFNAENTIDRSICSVYEQDWPSVELIVVNDGSTDASAEHIDYWERKFEEKDGYYLKHIEQKNCGSGGAVKTALKYVTGQYLTLLDADDRYLPKAISEKADYLDHHSESVMVRSNGYIISGINKWLFTYNVTEKTGDVFEMLMRGETYNWAGSYMVRTNILREFYENNDFYASRFGQNLQIMVPVAYYGKCGFIDKPLMEYIRAGNSLTKDINSAKAKEKSIRNAEGFLEIRRNIISSLPISDKDKKNWEHVAEAIYRRSLMQIGLEHGDVSLTDEAVHMLKKLKAYTIDDRIACSARRNKVAWICWRIVKKLLIFNKK